MPQMIPNLPVEGCPKSEADVFDVMKSELPNDWIVIHSKRFVLPATREHAKPRERECDFIIFSPKRGYLGLEVKGGQEIGRDQDGWYSVDFYGATHRIKDPGSQAQSATHTIRKYLQDFPEFGSWTPPHGWGVCFPGVTVNSHLDSSLPKEYVIDKSGLNAFRSQIERVFDANGMSEGLIPQSKIDAFLRALAPTFKLAPSLASRFDEERPALLQLTDEQADVLEMFEEFSRVAVKGAAGTGKTLVAMEKARRLAANGKRVLVLCFNRPLADHLATLADGFTVDTFHRFAKIMCSRASIPFKVPFEKEAKARFWSNEAADLLSQALEVYPDERYDAVIVDEAQDFQPVWWIPVESLLNESESTFYIFYDPNQQIYDGGPAEDLGLKSTSLKYNCRNTGNIAKFSCDMVGMEAVLKPGTPAGEAVNQAAPCKDERDMVDAVRKCVHYLVNENKVKTEQIIILTTGKVEQSPVYRAKTLGNLSLVELGQKPGANEVRIANLHRFKGLEADVVIVCDVKPGDEDSLPKHLYVATSRACHYLAMFKYA